jgi:hypothetical protein
VIVADEEALPFRDGSLDLVVSALALQFVNDLPGALIQIRRALKPDGLLLAALVGGDTLTELRDAFAAAEAEIEGGVSPRVAPFADLRDLGALLQRAGFALPVTDVDRLTVRYASPFALMHDLRRMGATNALVERRRRPLKRATLARMAEIYSDRFADADGRIRATFEIVWLSGWAPHESSNSRPTRFGAASARRRARHPRDFSRRQGGAMIDCGPQLKNSNGGRSPRRHSQSVVSPGGASLLLRPAAEVHPVSISGIDVAGIVDTDAFERAEVNGLRDERRDLAVLGDADPDALLETRIAGSRRTASPRRRMSFLSMNMPLGRPNCFHSARNLPS